MNRSVSNLIAVAERSEHGYADVPPGSINDEIESELAAFGYAVSLLHNLARRSLRSLRVVWSAAPERGFDSWNCSDCTSPRPIP